MSTARESIHQQDLDKVLKGFTIPVQPKVLMDVHQERIKPDPSLAEIARIVSADVGLSGAVLKTINSPFFGLRRQIESINQAVMLLGMDNVANLVTGYALRSSMQTKCSISLERFWDSASDMANISAAIARQLRLCVNPDEAYMLGLFIDCGIPVLACKYDDYKSVLIEGNSNPDLEMTEIEERHYDTNHAVIGYYTSRAWGLPEHIREAILDHHDIGELFKDNASEVEKRRDTLIAIQKMAEDISHTFRRLSDHLEWVRIKDPILDYIGIDEAEYQELLDDIHDMLRES